TPTWPVAAPARITADMAYAKQLADICASWPVGFLGSTQAVVSDVPVLLLAGALDPVTPPEYAHLTASTLSHGTVVEFADQGHVVATSGACASEITHRFLSAP